jgi:molecular chaperone DnaK
VEVTFDIDANGILSVSAKDKASNKEQSIQIEGSGGLSGDEIDRMVSDADAHAGEDKARRERVEKKNHLDSMVYGADKQLAEHGDKLAESDKKTLEEAIVAARQALEGEDTAAIDAAGQTLEKSLHKLAEALYKQGDAAAGEAVDEAAEAESDEDVIDAEYTEEKGDS